MLYHTLRCEKKEQYVIIQIESYPNNQDTKVQLSHELADLCSEIAWDDETRAIVLTFDGNLPLPPKAEGDQYGGIMLPSLTEPVSKLKQPVIAAIKGDAVGLGLELAMACDIRIGTEGAWFGLPGIREGEIPFHGGTQRLPRLVGRAKTLEMILTGELIDASEAERIGLIHRVVASSELINIAMGLAREMASKSPLAISFVKEALYSGVDLTFDQGLRMELDLYLLLFTTEDRTEGVRAFQQKRKPTFKGT